MLSTSAEPILVGNAHGSSQSAQQFGGHGDAGVSADAFEDINGADADAMALLFGTGGQRQHGPSSGAGAAGDGSSFEGSIEGSGGKPDQSSGEASMNAPGAGSPELRREVRIGSEAACVRASVAIGLEDTACVSAAIIGAGEG